MYHQLKNAAHPIKLILEVTETLVTAVNSVIHYKWYQPPEHTEIFDLCSHQEALSASSAEQV